MPSTPTSHSDRSTQTRNGPAPEKSVNFGFFWNIKWSEYDNLPAAKIIKNFITSYNNVVYYWKAELSHSARRGNVDPNKIRLYLFYNDGPKKSFTGFTFEISMVKSDKTREIIMSMENYQANRGLGWGWPNFDDKDSNTIRQRYGLNNIDPLVYRIWVQIPLSAFAYEIPCPLESPGSPASILVRPTWVFNLFKCVEDREKSSFWNCKLISGDGQIFYCHKVVLGRQSSVLDAMLRYPQPKNVNEDEFNFPNLGSSALKASLQFLYTGQIGLTDLSTKSILEVADAAEQYGFEKVKDTCAATLWQRIVKKPEDGFDVVRFSDLHQDWKYLKHRAMDVLMENFESLSLHTVDQKERFGGGEIGERLRAELSLFGYRRVEPSFAP